MPPADALPTVAEFHETLLAMIDARMDTEDPERGRELRALADACEAFEAVMHPMEETDA